MKIVHFLKNPVKHPLINTLLYVPISIFIVGYLLASRSHSVFAVFGLVFLGLIVWTLIEYFFHRFLFHSKGRSNLAKFLNSHHLNHHQEMHDPHLALAPPLRDFTLAFLITSFFAIITQSLSKALLLSTGVFLGQTLYSWVHYAVHQYPMRGRLGAFLKRHHLLHHSKYPHQLFGVTSPLWDWIFGTYRK